MRWQHCHPAADGACRVDTPLTRALLRYGVLNRGGVGVHDISGLSEQRIDVATDEDVDAARCGCGL
jgi:hypothetical protein